MKKIKFLIAIAAIAVLAGCKKDYLETEPSNAITEQESLSTVEKISSSLNGAYQDLFAFSPGGSGRHDDFGQKAWDLSNDLMGNDMIVHTQGYGWFNSSYQYTEFVTDAANRQPSNSWLFYYRIIGQANTILKYIDAAEGAQADKDVIKG